MKGNIEQRWVMLSKCINEFEAEYHKLANFYKLSDSSFWVLYELYNNEDGCTQKELYTDWCLNKQTVNSTVKYLINQKKECILMLFILQNHLQHIQDYKIIKQTY